jgi:hypothetical protein
VAGRAAFSNDEWQQLQWGLMMAGSHITGSDYPGLLKSFKEAGAASVFLVTLHEDESELIAALTKDQGTKRPPDVKGRAGLASDVALEHVRKAVAVVAAKAPEDLEPFRQTLVAVAMAMAGAVDGTSEAEAAAIERVKDAAGYVEPEDTVEADVD